MDPQPDVNQKLEIFRLRRNTVLRDALAQVRHHLYLLLASCDFNFDDNRSQLLTALVLLQYQARLIQQEHQQLVNLLVEEFQIYDEKSPAITSLAASGAAIDQLVDYADRLFVIYHGFVSLEKFEEYRERAATHPHHLDRLILKFS